MKKTAILLCTVISILILTTFSGCGTARPNEIKWYLSTYHIDGEIIYHHVGFNEYDPFNSVFSDSAEISFKKGGTFYFRDIEGNEFEGRYKRKKTMYDTEIKLTFADGRVAEGWYMKLNSNSDTVQYSAHFDIFGISYSFDNIERKFLEEDYNRCLKNLSSAICNYAKDGRMEPEHYPYYGNLQRAHIGRVGEILIAVAGKNAYTLSEPYNLCYTVNAEGIDRCEIREGDCIIRTAYGGLAIYYPQIEG